MRILRDSFKMLAKMFFQTKYAKNILIYFVNKTVFQILKS